MSPRPSSAEVGPSQAMRGARFASDEYISTPAMPPAQPPPPLDESPQLVPPDLASQPCLRPPDDDVSARPPAPAVTYVPSVHVLDHILAEFLEAELDKLIDRLASN